MILAFPLYMYLDWPRPGLSSGVPNFWGLSSVLSEALGKSYDLLLFHFLPSCQMGINNLTYLLGGRESSENGVILSVQVLKVVLLGEQSNWDWLVYYKPYTPLFHSLGAVTWSVSFWGSIQRGADLTTSTLVHIRTKHQPCTAFEIMYFPFSVPHSLRMLLFLACFLQWGPVGLSLQESCPMRALGEGLISGCFMSNSFLEIIVCMCFS